MANRIRIHAGAVSMIAELNDSPTAVAIHAALPLEAAAQTWGDEIYFRIPVPQSLDDTAVELVAVGDLGYWPTGRAFCIFLVQPPPAAVMKSVRRAPLTSWAEWLMMPACSKPFRMGTLSGWRMIVKLKVGTPLKTFLRGGKCSPRTVPFS